jgi:uncharacterized protein YjbJ (UPF0337 family)
MNWDVIEGKWKQLKGGVKARWGKLTDNDLEQIQGNREKLVGKVQERYGHNREKAEKEVDEWQKQFQEMRENAEEMRETDRVITYAIETDAFGNRWIKCLICGLGSYNPHDVEQRYCGACHAFHDDLIKPTGVEGLYSVKDDVPG